MAATTSTPAVGRSDAIQNEISSVIRAPVLVDNVVLHAEYERTRDNITGQTLSITAPPRDEFQYTHDRTYQLIEQEDSIVLTHPTRPGVKYNSAVYFNGNKLQDSIDVSPLIMFGTEDTSARLVPNDTISPSLTYGTELTIPNLRGQTLSDVDFEEKHVRLGQTVGVGFRTTDAVQQLFKGAFHSLNSFDVGLSFTGPRAGINTKYAGADIARHSTRFVAQDFYGIGLIKAMKYIGRYDNHTTFLDRFGNLLYAPNIFSITDRTMGDSKGVSTVKHKPIMKLANRVVAEGRMRASNDANIVAVDDLELQKQHGSVKTSIVFNPLARTPTQSRRAAAEGLRINKKAQSVLISEDHIDSWDIDPGDVVAYKSPSSGIERNTAILRASHKLREHGSDFVLVANESGIETLLNQSESVSEIEDVEPDRITQIQELNMSNTGTIGMRVRVGMFLITHPGTSARLHSIKQALLLWPDPTHWGPGAGAPPVPAPKVINNALPNKHAGMIIGHRYTQGSSGSIDMSKAARGAIGVGASLSTTASAYTHAGTTLTVASTTGFPSSGMLMIESEEDQKSMLLTYTGIGGATTFTGVSRTPALSGDVAFSPVARAIYARPRSHEIGSHRSRKQVVV
mgnify:CR=1 FL=1